MGLVECQRRSITERTVPSRDGKEVSFSGPNVSNIVILVSVFIYPFCANVGVTKALNPELCFLVLPALGERSCSVLLGSLQSQTSTITGLPRGGWLNYDWKRTRKGPLSSPFPPRRYLGTPGVTSAFRMGSLGPYFLTSLPPRAGYRRLASLMWYGGRGARQECNRMESLAE